MKSNGSYVEDFQTALIKTFLEVIGEDNPDLLKNLQTKFAIQEPETDSQRAMKYEELWDSLSEEDQYDLIAADAKINDLARRGRKIATTNILDLREARVADSNISSGTADSIEYVMHRLKASNVPADDVQTLMEFNTVTEFSLTPHPTNPTTLEYTKAGINIDRVMSNPDSTEDDLKIALRRIRDTAIVGNKKTPADEVDEALAIMDVVYDTAVMQRNEFEDALKNSGYAGEGVKVTTPLLKANIWAAGDGDGNENYTQVVLEEAITTLRRSIIDKYVEDLDKIGEEVVSVKERLLAGQYTNSQDMIDDLNSIESDQVQQEITDLAYKVDVFGFHYAKIDLRHNAVSIMITLEKLAEVAGVSGEQKLAQLDPVAQEGVLALWLENDEIMDKMKAVTPEDLCGGRGDNAGAYAARILGRIKTIAENPDMCEKLIIAETSNAAHAIAAMVLLRATGHEVANDKAQIDIVTLSESVDDLHHLAEMIGSLMENACYREHVEARGRLIVMIAKSDTVKLDGRGAEAAQDLAIGEVFDLKSHDPGIQTIFRELFSHESVESKGLGSVRIIGFEGGGAAFQRNGSTAVKSEIPHRQMQAGLKAGATDMGPAMSTLQGHQMQQLLSSEVVGANFLTAFSSQNLYAVAQIQGHISVRPNPDGIDGVVADDITNTQRAASIKAYGRLSDDPSFNHLLERGPWIAIKSGNVSSRPSKRGEGGELDIGSTPAEIKGKSPKAQKNRAITAEKIASHSGTHIFSLLGEKEGLQCLASIDDVDNPLHYSYLGNKAQRDAMRATATILYMAGQNTGFKNAWRMMVGKEHPGREEVKRLAGEYKYSTTEPNPRDVTLAYLENDAYAIAHNIYQGIMGKLPEGEVELTAPLMDRWPDLAYNILNRERGAEFSHIIEAKLARDFGDNPDEPISERLYRITQSAYTAADVTNAPIGMILTQTAKDQTKATKEAEKLLELPQCLGAHAIRDMLL